VESMQELKTYAQQNAYTIIHLSFANLKFFNIFTKEISI
jgi:hypothetical protein